MTARFLFGANEMDEYDVYCEFDIEKHKKKYINYLEVMIDKDGKVHYAVPSHQEWAIQKACSELKVSRDTLCGMTPPEYYFDWIVWLVRQSNCIAVWENMYIGEPNRKQRAKLKALKLSGLYKGKI